MGRKVRTTLPQTTQQLIPDWQFLDEFRVRDEKYKKQQKRNYDKQHRVRSQSPLPDDTPVLVRTGKQIVPGSVASPAHTPRSYFINTPSGQVRRNRNHLVHIEDNSPDPNTLESSSSVPNDQPRTYPQSPIMTRTRTGTEIRPPNKLNL